MRPRHACVSDLLEEFQVADSESSRYLLSYPYLLSSSLILTLKLQCQLRHRSQLRGDCGPVASDTWRVRYGQTVTSRRQRLGAPGLMTPISRSV